MSLLAPLHCDNFSNFPCFLWSWQCWGGLIRYSIGGSSIILCTIFFWWIHWECVFFRERTQGKGHPHHIRSRAHTSNTSFHCWHWPGSPCRRCVYQVSPQWGDPPTLPYSTLWKEVTTQSPQCFFPLRVKCVHQLFLILLWEICLLALFTLLFVYIAMALWIFSFHFGL